MKPGPERPYSMKAVYGDIMIATAVILPLAHPYMAWNLAFRYGLDPVLVELLLVALGAVLCGVVWTVRWAWRRVIDRGPRPAEKA